MRRCQTQSLCCFGAKKLLTCLWWLSMCECITKHQPKQQWCLQNSTLFTEWVDSCLIVCVATNCWAIKKLFCGQYKQMRDAHVFLAWQSTSHVRYFVIQNLNPWRTDKNQIRWKVCRRSNSFWSHWLDWIWRMRRPHIFWVRSHWICCSSAITIWIKFMISRFDRFEGGPRIAIQMQRYHCFVGEVDSGCSADGGEELFVSVGEFVGRCWRSNGYFGSGRLNKSISIDHPDSIFSICFLFSGQIHHRLMREKYSKPRVWASRRLGHGAQQHFPSRATRREHRCVCAVADSRIGVRIHTDWIQSEKVPSQLFG